MTSHSPAPVRLNSNPRARETTASVVSLADSVAVPKPGRARGQDSRFHCGREGSCKGTDEDERGEAVICKRRECSSDVRHTSQIKWYVSIRCYVGDRHCCDSKEELAGRHTSGPCLSASQVHSSSLPPSFLPSLPPCLTLSLTLPHSSRSRTRSPPRSRTRSRSLYLRAVPEPGKSTAWA